MSKGANVPLAANRVTLVLSWTGPVDVDISALLTTTTGKVRSDDDFIFYNQPCHRTQAVRHLGKQTAPASSDSLGIDLALVEDEIASVVVSGSAYGGNFGQLSNLALSVMDAASGHEVHRFVVVGASVETAMIVGEVYRRNGAWKFRAVGQGYASGLRGVAGDYGISVDDDELTPETPPPPMAAAEVVPAPQYYSNTAGAPGPQQAVPQQYGQPAVHQGSPQNYGTLPMPQGQTQVPANNAPAPQHLPQIQYQASPPAMVNAPVAQSESEDAEVTLQPFDTDNPFLRKLFGIKEFGRAPGRALAVYRQRVIDPDEKMLAAFKSQHGRLKWGYLILTTDYVRWIQTVPRQDEELYQYTDRIEQEGSMIRLPTGDQFQLKGFGSGRKFKAVFRLAQQANLWQPR